MILKCPISCALGKGSKNENASLSLRPRTHFPCWQFLLSFGTPLFHYIIMFFQFGISPSKLSADHDQESQPPPRWEPYIVFTKKLGQLSLPLVNPSDGIQHSQPLVRSDGAPLSSRLWSHLTQHIMNHTPYVTSNPLLRQIWKIRRVALGCKRKFPLREPAQYLFQIKAVIKCPLLHNP